MQGRITCTYRPLFVPYELVVRAALDGTFGETDTLYWAATGAGFADFPTVSYAVTAVSEPQAYALMRAGLVVIGFFARRRHNSHGDQFGVAPK